MYIPKRYGESKIDKCPFCSQRATTNNNQGVAVCKDHKESVLNEMRCACGDILELKMGKFGAYFNCMSCGNINMKKVLDVNDVRDVSENAEKIKESVKEKRVVKEITIRSDDPLYFD